MKNKVITILALFGLFLVGRAILGRNTLQSQESTFPINPTLRVESINPNFPEGLPENFPVYPNSEYISVTISENQLGRSFIWQTLEKPSLVYEYLKSELKIKSYIITNTSEVGNSFALSFEKDNTKGFLAVLKDGSSKTTVSVTIGIKE